MTTFSFFCHLQLSVKSPPVIYEDWHKNNLVKTTFVPFLHFPLFFVDIVAGEVESALFLGVHLQPTLLLPNSRSTCILIETLCFCQSRRFQFQKFKEL